MSEPLGFRPDIVKSCAGALEAYLRLMAVNRSVSTVEGAESYVFDHSRRSGMPEMTSAEDRAIRLTIFKDVGRDNRARGGQKRIESVEVEGREGSKLTFRIRYSDRVVTNADSYREHARDNSWARGDGWPDVSYEALLAAEMRWQMKRESEHNSTN